MSLPERQFFTLEEIAERWNCGSRAILSYGMRQRSTVAPKNREDLQDVAMLRFKALVPLGSCQKQTFEGLGKRGPHVPKRYRPSFEYCLPEIPAMFISDFIARGSVELRYGYFRDQFDVPHFGELIQPGTLGDPVKISLGDVVVTRCDRDKFERTYNVDGTGGERTGQEGGGIHPRTRNNYLRLIMALATTAVRGFDPRKPFEAANLIRETAEIDMDEKTLAGYVSEAYELQRRERK